MTNKPGLPIEPHEVETAAGFIAEVASKAGYMNGSTTSHIHKHLTSSPTGASGADAAKAVIAAAPIVASTVVAAAPLALTVAAIGGAIYGGRKLYKWLNEQ